MIPRGAKGQGLTPDSKPHRRPDRDLPRSSRPRQRARPAGQRRAAEARLPRGSPRCPRPSVPGGAEEPPTGAPSPPVPPSPPPRPYRRGFRSCTPSMAPRGRPLPHRLPPASMAAPPPLPLRRRKAPGLSPAPAPSLRALLPLHGPGFTPGMAAGGSSASALRRAGNEEFRRGQYGPAAQLYGRALALLEDAGEEGTGPGRGPGGDRGVRGRSLSLSPSGVPRRGGRRRGEERAARQPRRLPPQGGRLPPLRRRLLRVSHEGAGGRHLGGLHPRRVSPRGASPQGVFARGAGPPPVLQQQSSARWKQPPLVNVGGLHRFGTTPGQKKHRSPLIDGVRFSGVAPTAAFLGIPFFCLVPVSPFI